MKPIYLEFCGVNSFSEKASIDFGKLLQGGLFGIFGDTGSGKSTILDCIHFALYGKIERALGADSINYKCDRAYVIYDFELVHDGARHRYRVQRERRRKNNAVKAALYEYGEENALLALGEGADEVNEKIESIVGLTFDDFKKCIALPQGEFAGLVKAKAADRLKLVSRLFDLEKYGEKLSRTVRERHKAVSAETEILEARMQENEGGRAENIEELKAALKSDRAALDDIFSALRAAEEEWLKAEKLAEEKRAYDALSAEARAAEEKLGYYAAIRAKTERLAAAVSVSEKAKTMREATDGRAKAAEKAEAALSAEKVASARAEQLKTEAAASRFDEEKEKYALLLGRLQSAEGDVRAYNEAKGKLEECLKKYREIKDKAAEEPFEKRIAEIDGEMEKLGADESFAEFLKHHFKDVLLIETYGEVRADLRSIGEKYPETEEDVARLTEKYTIALKGNDKSFDVARAKIEFDEREKTRKELLKKRETVERRKKVYEDNEAEKKRIADDGAHYRERVKELEEKIAFVKDSGGADEVKSRLAAVKAAQESAERKIKETEERAARFRAETEKQKALEEEYAVRERAAAEALDGALKESGFLSVTEAETLVRELGNAEKVKAEADAFFSRLEAVRLRMKEAEGKAETFAGAIERAKAAEEKKAALEEERARAAGKIAVGEEAVKRLEEQREKYRRLEAEYKAKAHERELWEKLRSLTDKNRFMEFIASEYLQEICAGASKTLLSLTGGRYYLCYDGEFKAADNFNGGVLRSVKTLSGGETFLVSLSLALALGGAICAKSLRPIEFFFLDEGFGTLDGKLVDTVMDVLEKLKSSHFSVGVISHVEELKHRIDNKILVTGATEAHGSFLKTEAF